MSDDGNPKEGIDLRPDGGVHVWLDGTKHRLRRPRGREFRKLREELEDRLDAINVAADESAAWSDRLQQLGDEREEKGEPRITGEERGEDRRRGRELRDLTESEMAGWWASVITTLAVESSKAEDVQDADDMPPWLISPGQATTVLDHWRSAPSLSGAP